MTFDNKSIVFTLLLLSSCFFNTHALSSELSSLSQRDKEPELSNQALENVAKKCKSGNKVSHQEAQVVEGICLKVLLTLGEREMEQANLAASLNWFQRAVDNYASHEAMLRIGLLYMENKHFKNADSNAKKWLEKAGNNGSKAAWFYLGILYLRESNGESNSKAILYFEKAAKLGHAKANYNLYVFYQDRDFQFYDMERAIGYLQRAVAKNDADALFALGVLYKDGTHFKPSFELGEKYLTLAYKAQHNQAVIHLASLYSKNITSKESFRIAEHWLLEASKAGSLESKFNLAMLYSSYEWLDAAFSRESRKLLLELEKAGYKPASAYLMKLEQ